MARRHESASAAGSKLSTPALPAFVHVLPPWIRYKALLAIGRHRKSRNRLVDARMALERAAQLFPERKEARELLDQVRDAIGGTQIVTGSSDPPLPMRRVEFDRSQSHTVRGAMTGNLWRIEEKLGAGTMGGVFRVRNEATTGQDDFALKTYSAVRAGDETITRRFRQEALMWIRLGRHPNIVQAFWAERLEGALCLVMEYVPGKSLKDALGQGPLPPKRALPLALNLCDALRFARDALGLIHRDVKPENCMIGADGALKLGDFGVSMTLRNLSAPVGGTGELRVFRDRAGSKPYAPPEQDDLAIDLDERADIHAFGITLGEMLTGEARDRGKIAGDVSSGRLNGPLWQLVQHCVEEDRERRPRNLDELRRSLETCYADWFDSAAPPPPIAPAPSVAEYMDRGAAFIALGESAPAIESYNLALKMRPDDPALWAGLSAAHLKAGQHDLSIESADRGLSLGRKTSSLLNNKGQAYAAAGRPREALLYFDDALRLDPANPLILCNRAAASWTLNDRPGALEVCDLALAADPRSVRALVMKANILVEEGRVSEAHNALLNAAKIDPFDPDVLLGLSCVMDRLERPHEALSYAESALEHNAGNALMLRHRGWLLLKLNRENEAIECLNAALSRDAGDIEALRGKGLALLVKGDHAEAIGVLRTAADLAPDNLPVQQALRLAEAQEA